MVNEPSLNDGKNERPNVKKHPKATTNMAMVPPNTHLLYFKAPSKARS